MDDLYLRLIKLICLGIVYYIRMEVFIVNLTQQILKPLKTFMIF